MHSNTHYNRKKGIVQANFDSEDEGDFIADEQAHVQVLEQEEYYHGTEEHDYGDRNDIQGYRTSNAYIDKETLAHRKNRFILNNNNKMTKQKISTTQNSMSRRHTNMQNQSGSPIHSQNNSNKNVAFVSAQKPAIQNLPPSIVLNSKQHKLNSTTQIKGAHTVTNSFVVAPHMHLKNIKSFADGNHQANTTKSSPVQKHGQQQKYISFNVRGQQQIQAHPSNNTSNVRQSFKSSQTAGSGNNAHQTYTGSQYKTLNQNIKSQITMLKKQKQMEQANQQLKSQKNMTIKTKCVSLEVSQERNTDHNSPSSYFTTNIGKKQIRPSKIAQMPAVNVAPSSTTPTGGSGTLKIKRKPMISQTMKNSKKGSLNSTPTRQAQQVTPKNNDDPNQRQNNGSNESTRMEFQSPQALTNTNNNDILPESIHNIQFTRNTQANAKTVSNVAQVLHPVQHHNYDTSKKNLSQTKSVALSIDNSDANKGGISSQCNSLTHLNKNFNLRMDKKSYGLHAGDENNSKQSSSRGENLGIVHEATPFKQATNKSGMKQMKKMKQYVSSEAMSPHKNSDMISAKIAVSPSHQHINQMQAKSNFKAMGVSFTKNKISGQQHDHGTAKNMNINESLGKKTIGLSSKLKIVNTNQSQNRSQSKGISSQPQHTHHISTTNPGSMNARVITNYVSKTAHASAYASKNNSNNSSVARGDNLNPVIQHKTLGSRISAVLKKKKQTTTTAINSEQDQQSSNAKQSFSHLNIGASSLSLKDKQISMSFGKKPNMGQKTITIGESNSGALKQVTNAHHVQSQKQQMYATEGSKIIKNATMMARKSGGVAHKVSFGGETSSKKNFFSFTNTTLKTKPTKKTVGKLSFKQDVKKLDAYRSANASSSLTNNSKTKTVTNISNITGSIKIHQKLPHRLSHLKEVENKVKTTTRQESEDGSISPNADSNTIYNSINSKGNCAKKQLQPSQAKNSMRSVKESYRRAGFSSAQLSTSPHRDEDTRPNNNYSTRQPQATTTNPLFSFNDIKEEVKETESQHDVNISKNPTFNIDLELIQQTGPSKHGIHRETPKSTKKTANRDETENSIIVQMQEYRRDINNLKKSIAHYFKQYGEMQASQCTFYRIGRVLGRGAFGKVNLACHKVTENLVAIKALEKKVLDNEKNTKKRVMQEIAILKQSNHQNVVRLYDSFETHKHICFVMELCQGGDLLSYVRKRRKLKEDNAKYLFKQLIEGLHYIHSQKFVIHRDIKLDNILLDSTGKIKICDFGVSKQVKSDRERMYEQCGTPAYIAPEVSNKQKGYKGFKADMWSAGVCLYVMLIGTVPFRASSMKELHELIRKGKYSLQGEILSNDAKNLLSQLINVNYHKRLSAEETLKHPWFTKTQDGKEYMNYDREDLSEVIFTQKEIETINKDYITRLEKLKKQRLKRETVNSPTFNERDHRYNSTMHVNTTTFDEDILFTEHNLDTKEDQKQDLFEQPKHVLSMFKQEQQEFQKFEGLIVKKPANEFSPQTEEKNQSEKSIIFCPFNSSFSQFDEDHPELFDWPDSVKEILQPKKSKIIRFSKKCRDLNREYECNNNADLDNGVYNAFVNEQEMEAEKNQKLHATEEDEMPTQSMQQSSSNSIIDSEMSFQNSDLDDLYKNGRAPQNSFVQNEISIHESMQRGHENQCTINTRLSTLSKVAINLKLIDYTIELFKYNSSKSDPVYETIKSKLKSGLQLQELNYLTAAYYLSQKYDRFDE